MDLLIITLEVAGSVAFAISGVMVARETRMDIFGAVILGFTTSCGGGLMRDLVLGRIPPALFQDPTYALLSVAVSVGTFFYLYHKHPDNTNDPEAVAIFDNALNVADSIGLAAFIVVGYQVAEFAGYSANGFLCVFCGVITGIGGGILRDVLAGQIPFIMQKHVYGMAAIAGGIVYFAYRRLSFPYIPSALVSMGVTCLIRFLAIRYRWNLRYSSQGTPVRSKKTFHQGAFEFARPLLRANLLSPDGRSFCGATL
ncbi:MAG: trimeric intracellular cation channel family protein [Lachnospiraceae bacterium]|nr:trimeric intracellular cation channel family protein [Lachnospiraceae bacterium]